jgi:hypothetical protein
MITTSPVTYTNRRGQRYYLGARTTKTGKTRYVFAREPPASAIEQVPEGFEITESINGVVSLRRRGQTTDVLAAEIDLVRSQLARHAHLARHQVEARQKTLLIHEPQNGDPADLIATFGFIGNAARESLARRTRYVPVLRFTLVDADTRTFTVERMCWRGGLEGWRSLHASGGLVEVVPRYLPHVGKDSFFDLF